MANANKLSIEELKSLIATYVASNKLAQGFSATFNLNGLLQKIGKIYTVEQTMIDKMQEFDGEFLNFGKTVEEWQTDFILPEDTASAEDVEVVKSKFPTHRPTVYSYALGRKTFVESRDMRDIKTGVNTDAQLTDFVMAIQRILSNSKTAWRYAAKRQLVGRFADAAAATMADTDATLWVKGTSQSTIGKRFKNSGTGTKWAVLVKAYSSTADKSFDEAIAAGYLVEYKTVTTIAAPNNTATGEAFIKAVKTAIEDASDLSEGNSLSGNTLGVTGGMTLFIKKGIIPSIEVDTMAGAFNKEELGTPAKIKVLPDFGSMTDTDVYAVLVDDRALRLFPTEDESDYFVNGYKGFVNYFNRFDATAAYSPNAFIHVFKNPTV